MIHTNQIQPNCNIAMDNQNVRLSEGNTTFQKHNVNY